MSIDPLCVAYSSSQEHRRLPMNLVTFDIDELPAIGSTDHDGSFDRQSFLDETSGGSTTQTWIVYNGNSNTPYAEFNGSGTLLERYLAGPSYVPGETGMVARTNASGVTDWYLTGKLGSVRDIVNTSGTVIDHISYGAFGTVRAETNQSSGSRFKYDGMLYDETLDSYYDNARYYDPNLGLFTSHDPIEFESNDFNITRFVFNDPTNFNDISGLADDKVDIHITIKPNNPTPPGQITENNDPSGKNQVEERWAKIQKDLLAQENATRKEHDRMHAFGKITPVPIKGTNNLYVIYDTSANPNGQGGYLRAVPGGPALIYKQTKPGRYEPIRVPGQQNGGYIVIIPTEKQSARQITPTGPIERRPNRVIRGGNWPNYPATIRR